MQSRLGVTGSLSDKIFLGSNVGELETGDMPANITRVNLSVDSDHYYTAGDDTGRAIEVTCPWGSQEMANSILASVSGKTYQPYTATDALLDPAAEIGDAVTVGGYYSVIASINNLFDRACAPTISAPESDEIDDEYPYESSDRRETNRQLAQTRSLISKTAEEIRLEVANEINGLSASISVQLDSITSTVQGLGNQVSQIQQTVNSITLDVTNGTASSQIRLEINGITVASQTIKFTGDVVFESDLADGSTLISGDCIQTGEISANYIHLGGKMDVYQTANNNYFGGYLGYMSGMTSSGTSTAGIAIASSNEAAVVICTTNGARMGYDGVSTVVCTSTQVSISSDRSVFIYGDTVYINGEPTTTSDERLKTQKQYNVDKYLGVFDRLRPCTFVYNGHARRHMGLIAQEVQNVLADEGIPESDFAALCTEPISEEWPDGLYTLRYGEIQIMSIAKIHQLDARIKELEAKVNGSS